MIWMSNHVTVGRREGVSGMKLLGISGTIVGSKTGIAVQSVLDAAKQFYPEIETEYLDMKDYQVQFCDGRDPSAYTGIRGPSSISCLPRIVILSGRRFSNPRSRAC